MKGRLRLVLLVGLGLIPAQAAAGDQVQPRLEKVAAPHVFSVDGATLYDAYCTSCHGRAARGDGRAARLLDTPVPNLTLITYRDGRFDERHVMFHILRGSGNPMPEWHGILRANYSESDGYAHRAAVNLVRYIGTLQAVAAGATVPVPVSVAGGPAARQLVKVNAPVVHSVDGATLYEVYCATCHGRVGRGDGPASTLIGTAVPDLTHIAQRDGAFDRQHVLFAVAGHRDEGAQMPDWGRIIERNYTEKIVAQAAERNLVLHLESLQAAPRR